MTDFNKASKYSNPVTRPTFEQIKAGVDHDALMQSFMQGLMFRRWFRANKPK